MEVTLDQALQKGIEAHKAGKVQEADQYYTAILKANPKHPDANHNMGVLAVGIGKVEAALPFFKTALDVNSNIDQFWLSYLDALIKLGRLDDAKSVFEQAKSNGAKGDGFDQIENRLPELEKTIQATPSPEKTNEPTDEQLQSLINLYTQSKYQETMNQASQLLKQFPNSINLYNIIGATNKNLGKLTKAVMAYRKATQINPDYFNAHNNLGVALQEQGRLDEAIEAFKKALTIKPDYAAAYNNIGVVLQEQGKIDEAIEAYNKVISIQPENAEAYNNVGVALKEQGKIDEAIEAYNKVISIQPENAEAYNNIGVAFKDLGKQDEAVSNFQKAFTIRSNIVPKDDTTLAPATTSLFFELTNKCNFHCVFCPSDFQKRDIGSMNVELVKKLYTEASEKKIATVVNLHLMGEPTLHPKLLEILKFGASKNIKTDLVTNGSTLVPKVVPKLLDSLYGTVTASHMTPTEETYHFRGKVGLSWDKYIGNLRLLVREYMKRIAKGNTVKNIIDIRVMSTMNTAANCTITETVEEARSIFKEWSDFVASVEEELGMDGFERVCYRTKDLLKDNGSSSISYPLQRGIKITFWRAFTFANTRVSEEYELEENVETAYCPHPFTDVGVLWNGDVTLCCLDHDGALSIGNINDSSIEEIIQNKEAQKLRGSMLGRYPLPSICQTCQAKPVKLQSLIKEHSTPS